MHLPDVRQAALPPEVVIGTAAHVPAARRLLRAARHPGFVGPDMFDRYARDGGFALYTVGGEPAAVSLMGMSRMLLVCLSVVPECRGRGLGQWVVRYLKPNFVRAVESAVPFFERAGFTPIGEWKQGLRLRTRVLVRASLVGLAGRLGAAFAGRGGG